MEYAAPGLARSYASSMTTKERLASIMESISVLEAKEADGTATSEDSDTLDDLWQVVLDLEKQIELEEQVMANRDKNFIENALSRLTYDMWNRDDYGGTTEDREVTNRRSGNKMSPDDIQQVLNYARDPEKYVQNARYKIVEQKLALDNATTYDAIVASQQYTVQGLTQDYTNELD